MLRAHAPGLAGVDSVPYMTRVYGWMTVGLLVSALAAVATISAGVALQPGLFIGLAIAELALVFGISFAIDRLTPGTAAAPVSSVLGAYRCHSLDLVLAL